jgi:hypothetical protein
VTKKTLGPGDMAVARMDIPAVPGLWPGGGSCERFGTSYAAAMQAIIEDVGPAIVAHYSAEIERLEEAVKSDERLHIKLGLARRHVQKFSQGDESDDPTFSTEEEF